MKKNLFRKRCEEKNHFGKRREKKTVSLAWHSCTSEILGYPQTRRWKSHTSNVETGILGCAERRK